MFCSNLFIFVEGKANYSEKLTKTVQAVFFIEYVNIWSFLKLAEFLNLLVVNYVSHTLLFIIPLISEVRCDSYYKIIVHSVLENTSKVSI